MDESENYPKYSTDVAYSDESNLNTLEICLPRQASKDDSKRYWIIYIHGGAWRDPNIDATSSRMIRDKLLDSPANDSISGYASINYRLSPHPSHSSNPSNPSDPARNAKHPDHINDILTAILYLQEQYGFEDRYILVGHSCGATLAFQVAMKRFWGSQYESTYALELNVVPPVAIIGLEGIYDIPALVKYHSDQPYYKDFISNAYGDVDWSTVSPTSGVFDNSWPDGKLVVLAHSPEDSLVEWEQPELQRRALEKQSWKIMGDRAVKMFELKGDHDEVWQTGDAARAIEFAIEELVS